jgi:L-2-hydroxyglutarate oxidase LhgO
VKARVCKIGAEKMIEFHEEHNLPLKKIGKILVCTNQNQVNQIDLLLDRAKKNNIEAYEINHEKLKEMEPEVNSIGERGIYVPITSVGSPKDVMNTINNILLDEKIKIFTNTEIKDKTGPSQVSSKDGSKFNYGFLINTSGSYSDVISNKFEVGQEYTMLPFRGLYWELSKNSGINLNHLIYPVPDLRFPFLGIHTTSSIDGKIYLGPTASFGFGREHYRGIKGINLLDTLNNLKYSGMQFIRNHDGFRNLALQELFRLSKLGFAKEARKILPNLKYNMLSSSSKAGIRAQIFDKSQGRLVNDFLAVKRDNSLHILNSISPAWTCSFEMSKFICSKYMEA